MRALLATFLRELMAYFFSPLAYVVLTFFLLINGYAFWYIVTVLSDPRAGIGAPLEFFFAGFFFWLVVLFITPVLTMRLLAEERRSGTIEVLMTAPVTEGQVVLGKYFAALAYYLFLWLPTLAYAGILAYYGEVDWGPVASGYLGVVGVGAVFMAIGVFASSFTRNQIVAAVITFAVLILMFMVGLLDWLVNAEWMRETVGYVNLLQHMDDFAKGIVDTRRLVYYVSVSALFLFLSARILESKKWR